MSTQNPRLTGFRGVSDPAELVALVVAAKRPVLLRVHRHRLRADDLEECFAQAALELVANVRRGGGFANRAHAERALEQRFLSRVHDRRRALAGRSVKQAGLEQALALSREPHEHDANDEVADPRADVQRIAFARMQLALLPILARQLSADQRLVIACQVALTWDCGEFCGHFGWSPEKYRKVAQRGRARLRALAEACPEHPGPTL